MPCAGGAHEVDEVGGPSRPASPARTAGQRASLILVKFAAQPPILIAPTAAGHPQHGDARRSSASAKGGVAELIAVDPGGQVDAQQPRVEGDRRAIRLHADHAGAHRRGLLPVKQAQVVQIEDRLRRAAAIHDVEARNGGWAAQLAHGDLDVGPLAGRGVEWRLHALAAAVGLVDKQGQLANACQRRHAPRS
jgi:hypothetical protein